MNEKSTDITFVIPGDLHLTDANLENHRTANWMIDEVNIITRLRFSRITPDPALSDGVGSFPGIDRQGFSAVILTIRKRPTMGGICGSRHDRLATLKVDQRVIHW